jgi:hypothetical protein
VVALAVTLGAVGCADGGDDVATAPARLARAPRAANLAADQAAGILLACPSNAEARAAAWIGPAGGIVEARGATLTVPAGAVAVSTLFEVVVPASQTMTVDIHAVGVEGFQFLTPATITLNFARCAGTTAPIDQFQGAYVDLATAAILEYMGGVVDRSGHKLSFTTLHLSGYAVAY